MQEKLENEITKTSNFKLAHMFEIPRLFNFVTYYFTYLILKIRMLYWKKREFFIYVLLKEKYDCFQHFLGQRKMVFLLEKDAFFRSRVVSSLIEPHHFFFAILGNINDRGHSTMGSNCFYILTGKFQLLNHCNFTRFFKNFF